MGIPENPVHGVAEWMGKKEIKQRYQNKNNTGHYLSQDLQMSQKDSNANTARIGRSGSGKSMGGGFLNVLLTDNSCVVTDLSGEYYKNTSGHRKENGAKIQAFIPFSPAHSLGFNPQPRLQSHQEKKFYAESIAGRMHSVNDPIWETEAAHIMYLTVHAQCEYAKQSPENGRYNNPGNLLWIISNLRGKRNQVNAFFAEALVDDPFALAQYKSFISNDEKFLSSVISTAEAALDLFSDPAIRQLTSRNELCLDRDVMRKEQVITYIIIPEHLTEYYGLLTNLVYTALNNEIMRFSVDDLLKPDQARDKDERSIVMMMDEFANMGKLKNITGIITTIRKRNASINIMIQSPSQLESIYGTADTETILSGGISTEIILPGSGLSVSERVEKILGYRTVYDSPHGGVDQRTVRQPLMNADEVRMLEDEHAIVITSNRKPMKIKTPHAYKTDLAELMAKPPCPIPTFPDTEECLLPFDALFPQSNLASDLGQVVAEAEAASEELFANTGRAHIPATTSPFTAPSSPPEDHYGIPESS